MPKRQEWKLRVLLRWRISRVRRMNAAEYKAARKRLGTPVGGTVGGPDKRDIFSFRGRTGGGRFPQGRDGRRGGRGGRQDDDEDGDWPAQSAITADLGEDGAA